MSNPINNLISMFMQNKLQTMPQMQMFNQMMGGKNKEQQIQTLLNLAKSKGIDVNAKIITEEQLKMLHLK